MTRSTHNKVHPVGSVRATEYVLGARTRWVICLEARELSAVAIDHLPLARRRLDRGR